MKRISLIFLLMSLSSCAIGTKMSFNQTTLNSPQVSDAVPLTVVTRDARSYVLSGDKTPQWVGLQRSGYGIPYGVHTSSGKSLAQEFSESIFKSFKQRSASVGMLVLPVDNKTREQVNEYLRRNVTDGKILLLEINDWKSDTMSNISFSYDLTMTVLDKNLSTLGLASSKADKKLPGSFLSPVGESERVVTREQISILNELLNSSQVVSALSYPPSPPGRKTEVRKAVVEKPKEAHSVKSPVLKEEFKTSPVKKEKQVEPMPLGNATLDGLKQKLNKLKRAKVEGIITEQEYQQKRKALVDPL